VGFEFWFIRISIQLPAFYRSVQAFFSFWADLTNKSGEKCIYSMEIPGEKCIFAAEISGEKCIFAAEFSGEKCESYHQHQIILSYRNDFSKHAPKEILPRINMVWDSIPAQLSKENKKFIYGRNQRGCEGKRF